MRTAGTAVPCRGRLRPSLDPPQGERGIANSHLRMHRRELRRRRRGGGGSPWTAEAVDLILARRAWAVVARDNDREDNGEGGDPPGSNDDAASGGGDNDNASSRMRSGGGTTDGGGGGHHRRNNDDAEEGGHIIAGTKTTMDTDAATIAVGTTPRGEKGAVASSGGRSRVCVNFGQPSPRGRRLVGHRRGRLSYRHRPSLTSAIVAAVDEWDMWWGAYGKKGGTNLIIS